MNCSDRERRVRVNPASMLVMTELATQSRDRHRGADADRN
jgi:hypothetical protein